MIRHVMLVDRCSRRVGDAAMLALARADPTPGPAADSVHRTKDAASVSGNGLERV